MSRRRRVPVDAGKPGWVMLVATVLHGVPRLDGALCAGQPGIFDAHDAADRDAR
ncbi:hypothetical protein QGN32_02170 [Mycolicibacterium sp. ND9-15]|uniref:hypothetical protein n=1 Tax=Mycolicibacterium sp. ND9-15 TaxID=3042320 RepID=UPI002DD7D23E|nr:hypothetical protein [Mycolicibacterium sp. ND9-15]WSE56756.1 hypothetical protein QGN32_02170 [Mycolicibacterium sp. ND9-15]